MKNWGSESGDELGSELGDDELGSESTDDGLGSESTDDELGSTVTKKRCRPQRNSDEEEMKATDQQ